MTTDQEGQQPFRGQDLAEAHADADLLWKAERERLRALVDADVQVVHSVTRTITNSLPLFFDAVTLKEPYLGGLASGQVNDLLWEPGDRAVRM